MDKVELVLFVKAEILPPWPNSDSKLLLLKLEFIIWKTLNDYKNIAPP